MSHKFKITYFDSEGEEFDEVVSAIDAAAALGMVIDDDELDYADDAPFVVEQLPEPKRKAKAKTKTKSKAKASPRAKKGAVKGNKLKTVPMTNKIQKLSFDTLPEDIQKALKDMGLKVVA